MATKSNPQDLPNDLYLPLVQALRTKGVTRFDKPVQLSTGGWSREFLDVKAALCSGVDLAIACRAIDWVLGNSGIEYDAIGGLTMGADQFAYGTAVVANKNWFVVRKAPKGRGTDKLIEGFDVAEGTRVVLAEDTVTTGTSIKTAFEVLIKQGAQVVAAVTAADRGGLVSSYFDERKVPYFPLTTFIDLGMEPPDQQTLG